jgi:hypothetical protein
MVFSFLCRHLCPPPGVSIPSRRGNQPLSAAASLSPLKERDVLQVHSLSLTHGFRNSWRVFAVLSLAGASCAALAQTTPQLLPYTAKLIAGGGSVATFTVSQTCPSGSPNVATDTYGDGCLATDIQLTAPRSAIADGTGNVFFSDYTNGLVRRVDAVTGVVTAVAGGASSSPAKNASCGSGSASTSTDALGDGCLGTQVKIGKPAGLAFDAGGNLYFADYYNYNVREIHATAGVITTTGTITLVDGNTGGANTTSDGYEANNGSLTSCSAPGAACIVAATQGLLRAPYDVVVDPNNNVLIPDEYYYALLAVNQSATTQTVATISIPAGTVGKIAGAQKSNNPVCTNGTSSSSGCYSSTFATGPANTQYLDNPFTAALSGVGNIYISNAYNYVIAQVNTSGIMSPYAGVQGTISKTATNTIRNTAGSFPIGAVLGSTADPIDNLYLSDETNGLIWRVDGASTATGGATAGSGHLQYVVGGGGSGTKAGTACSANSTSLATDSLGDGCPALQAKFGANAGNASNTSLGVFGLKLDMYSNLYLGDASNNLVREIATGAQFGVIGANQPTDILDIHFGAGDTQIAPVTAGSTTTYPSFQITSGTTNFKLGTPTCTTNNDNTPANAANPLTASTTDCLLPVTATPTTLGGFSGTLQVTSAAGAVSSFPLSGVYAQSPNTRTAVTYTTPSTCAGTTTYAVTTPVTITATVIANGPAPPTGSADTVTFYANNGTATTQLGQPVAVTNIGSSSSPTYAAVTTYTFSTPGTYTISAVYSGDSYFKTSMGTDPITVTTANPAYTITPIAYQQGTVSPGQTALYSFNVNQTVFTGTINFSVTGLPPNSSYTLSPQSVTGTGCSMVNTVALSILTQQQQIVQAAGVDGSGHGAWRILAMGNGMLLLLLAAFGRKRARRFRGIALALAAFLLSSGAVGCGKAAGTVLQPGTPTGSYVITVTASGGSGSAAPITFSLTVH